MSRGANTVTAFTYNADGTAASRTDYDPTGSSHYSYFTYSALGQLAGASLPDGGGTAAYAWGLDGNLASRTWGTHVTGAYAYDRAKRPINLTLEFDATSAGGFAREYDRAGNATRESQALNGIGNGLAANSIQYFEYDAASRLTRSYFGVSEDPTKQRLYGYDASGNRLSVADEGATFYYSYDATDALTKKGTDPYGLGADSFLYDELGQLQTSRPSDPDSAAIDTTAYRYDPAGHLVCISTSGDCGSADTARTTFAIDALGRQAARTVGTSPTVTYAYLGTSAQVSSTAASGALSAYSAIDAIGNRLSTGTSGAYGYLVADLHGNVAASISGGSSPGFLSAYRYDPYGQTLDTYSAANPVPVPFRYQGRLLQSAEGATDLYDFGARSYDPNLGVFTSFDSVSGSAQNPLTLNRYLYALANPGTLIDPDGHCAYNANTRQTEDTPGSPCVGIAKGYSGIFTAKPVAPGPGPGSSVCAQTSYHAAGCGSAPSNPDYWNSTSPSLVKFNDWQEKAIWDFANANALDWYQTEYLKCQMKGFGATQCQGDIQAKWILDQDGRCHQNWAGCILQAGADSLGAIPKMAGCLIDAACRDSVATHYDLGSDWGGSRRFTGEELSRAGLVFASDIVDRLSKDWQDQNWPDAFYLATSLGISVGTGKIIPKLPLGANAAGGLEVVSNLSNVGWLWSPSGTTDPPTFVSADPRVILAYRPPAPFSDKWWQSQWWNPFSDWPPA